MSDCFSANVSCRALLTRFGALFCCLMLLLFASGRESGAVSHTPFSTPFSYYADQQDLGTVLMAFARSQGYGASMSQGVAGKVSGRFNQVPPATFLGGIQAAFDVNWYSLGRTLYFYNTRESNRTFITPRSCSAQQLENMLRQSSVFSPQLPPTVDPGGNMLVISGPPEYLAQVTQAVTAYETAQTGNIVMEVFPLKYAWAEDITVSSMDKTVTIPGIASILRAMLNGSPTSSSRVTQEKATVEKLGGTGLAALGRQEPVAPPEPSQPQQPQTAPQGVNIMADARVNAVLVNDAAYRMPYYKQVIADLDKPVELVEIHAAIVDIDTNFKRNLGITYQGAYDKSRGWGGSGSISGTSDSFSASQTQGTLENAGATLSTIYTHGTDFFLTRIQALETDGDARVLGRPSVLTVDNVQATLENTTTYYVQVQGYQAVDLYKVEAGTVLRVTPHIINENGRTSIKLAVSVQDDQDNTSSTTTTSTGVPPIKQTKINTQAIIGANQSLLIGGYYYEQKSTDANGIPVLMNIPVLGNLFKATDKTTKRMERLILITPRVVHLNDLPKTPSHIDDPSFHRAPTQSDYEPRTPVPSGGGCTRRVSQEPVQHAIQESR